MSGSGLLGSLSPQLFRLVLADTAWGHVWLLRGAIMAVLGAVLCFSRGRWSWIAGALLSAALVGSIAWLGHAGAGDPGRRPLTLAADVAHLLAVSVWPAGLLPFALLLRRYMKAGALPPAYAAARRFSAMNLMAVSVLTASGVANSLFLVGSLHALASSTYGRVLMFKVVLVVVAVGLGAWNLLVHEPLLASDSGALRAMQRKVWLEIALGALIVLVTALLGTLPPAWYP
jgi:putative copper resistance protein D